MQIADARKAAERFLKSNLIESQARRPLPDAKVMTRYPPRRGDMITAATIDDLREKLARRIKAKAAKTH